jgi:hypothetical protein
LKECQNDEQKMSHIAKYVIQPKENRTNSEIGQLFSKENKELSIESRCNAFVLPLTDHIYALFFSPFLLGSDDKHQFLSSNQGHI